MTGWTINIDCIAVAVVLGGIDAAEKALKDAVAEDQGWNRLEMDATFGLDLKLGDWCLTRKDNGYRMREFYVRKVPILT